MIRIGLFLALSVFFAYVSRRALVRPRTHGFFRFFVWEALSALFLLNVPHWIDDPFGPRQLVSWTLITVSAALALAGARALRTYGQAGSQRTEPELYAFERTSCLVTRGIYRYLRHPLYSSLLFLAWGIFLKRPGVAGLALAAAGREPARAASTGPETGTAGHPPAVRKIAALPRPRGIDAAAAVGRQEFAGAVRRFLQGQLRAVAGQDRMARDELVGGQPQRGGGGLRVGRLQQHRTGPAAAGAALPANEGNGGGHGTTTAPRGYCMNMRSPPGPIMIGFFSSCSSQATLMFLTQARLRARWKIR